MGAQNFINRASGKRASEAYDKLYEEAVYEYGHDPCKRRNMELCRSERRKQMTLTEIKAEYNLVDVEALENVLCDMAVVEFEPYEAAKSVISDIVHCESEETYNLLNKFFIGIFGWSLETLLKRAKGES